MSSLDFSVPDPRASISDESSSIVSTSSTDGIPPSSPAYRTMSSERHLDRAAQQLNASSQLSQSGPADSYREQDQRQHAGGQPLPPGSGDMAPSSPTAPSNLSDYARLMLQHTKQQLDATSASPPPPHIRVAGPLGHSQHQQRRRHAHTASLPNGTSPIMNGIPAARS